VAGPGVSLFGDWGKAKAILGNLEQKFEAAADRAMMQEAQFLRGEIVKYMREGAILPLDAKTIAVRAFIGFKGTKPLIHSADMRNSIQVTRLGKQVFVGILRTAKSKGGKDLANIAQMMEEGATVVVPITAKSRRFYHAALAAAGIALPKMHGAGGGGGVAIAVVHIPARPFMGPVFEKHAKPEDVRARFFARMAELFKG
jgi:hypothetical protein